MENLIATRVTLVWLLLVGATLASWALDQNAGPENRQLMGIAILVIAIIKVRFVMREFKEVRGAPVPLKLLSDGWCLLISILLITMFLWVS